MKKVKIMLSAIAAMAVLGGTFAFKTKGQNRKCGYTSFSTHINGQDYCSLPFLVSYFDCFQIGGSDDYAGTVATINGNCTDAAIPVSAPCTNFKIICTAEQ